MKIINEFYDSRNDKFSQDEITRTRRVHLTLRHLNKLRKKREMHNLETEIRKKRLEQIYGNNDQESSDLGF